MASSAKPPEDEIGDGRWMSMHKRFLIDAQDKEPDVVFIGDSLVARLAQSEVWERLFISMHCLNFGICGDRTENILWRIVNGELSNCIPKVIVLSAGSNNYDDTAEQIGEGIQACVDALISCQSSASIVVLKLLPCGQLPNKTRDKFSQVNSLLDQQFAAPGVHLVSVDPGFVNSQGRISHHDLFDYAHLTRHAYIRAFEPLADFLQELLGGNQSEGNQSEASSVAGN